MRISKKARKRKKKLQMKNKRLVKKYYWLRPIHIWTGKPLKDYDYTWIEWGWCDGWDKAFGQMYMDELGAAIKEAGQKNYQIVQIKEKYGQARLYDNGSTEKVHEIIHKYEIISENICMRCGREAPTLDDGWVYVYCPKCYKKIIRRREKYFHDNHPEKPIMTDDEIMKQYKEIICSKPNEDSTWLPNSYSVRRFSKDGDEIITYDISDTVNRIRNRQRKWIKVSDMND